MCWEWKEPQREPFKEIKMRLTGADVLMHYNPEIPVVLATEASEYGLGAVIYHKRKDGTQGVVAYASRSLTKEERNYAQIEKEALGIVYGVEKFIQFLYGRKLTLPTDHQPLVRIFGPKIGMPMVAAKWLHRWGLRLMAYSFDIEYRNTAEFANADGLSPLPDPRELPTSEVVVNAIASKKLEEKAWEKLPLMEKEMAKAGLEAPILKKVLDWVKNGWTSVRRGKEWQPYEQRKFDLSIYKGCLM